MNASILDQSQQQTLEVSSKIKDALNLNSKDLNDFSKLIIIPDGTIWNLNFSALSQIEDGKTSYLGNKVDIVFKYFTERAISGKILDTKSVLAFSFNEKSDASLESQKVLFRNLNSSLPGTSKEVLSISKLMEGEYHYATEANETSFKQESTSHNILHLAVHGFQNEYNPENSFLKFASADSANDGKLHAYEIYNLDLNADLAVLSACNSGNGKIVAGEGMMSIGRAFSYAGVRSLLISRWEVSDYSAPHLMKYFYQGLKKGMYKSEALRYAQTQYLDNHSDDLTSSPFFWSSFYVLGDDSPIYQKASFTPWMIGLLVTLILSGTVFFFKKKSQAKVAA
jgi:CHAT domain-containing protein